MASDPCSEKYAIGMVARLTGIAEYNLRSWERRYGFPKPVRSGRIRFYSEADVKKLSLIQDLVNLGENIGQLAGLSIASLEARLTRLRALDSEPQEPASGPVSVGLCADVTVDLDWQALCSQVPALLQHLPAQRDFFAQGAVKRNEALDFLILESPIIEPELLDMLRAAYDRGQFRQACCFYRFASADILEGLRLPWLCCLRLPGDGELYQSQIIRMLRVQAVAASDGAATRSEQESSMESPRYSLEQLSLLSRMSSAVACECPSHISSLMQDLMAFEQYSRSCESRNPADRAFHDELTATVVTMRQLLEGALDRLIEHEGWQDKLAPASPGKLTTARD